MQMRTNGFSVSLLAVVMVITLASIFTSTLYGQQPLRVNDGITILRNAPQPISVRSISGTPSAAGSNNYYYWLAVNYPRGAMFPVGPVAVLNAATVPAATVTLRWSAVSGATTYTIVRTATANFPTTGTCVACAATTAALTFVDTGAVLVNNFAASGINQATSVVQLNNRDFTTPVLTIGSQIRLRDNAAFLDNETGALWSSNAEFRVSAPAGAYLDWSDRVGEVVAFRTWLEADMDTVTSLKGTAFRVRSTGGDAGTEYLQAVQGISYTGVGTVNISDVWGANFIANHDNGITNAVYGVVGTVDVSSGATIGALGIGAGVMGVYEDYEGINETTNFTGAVIGAIWDTNATGPDGAVVALLQGDSVRRPENNPNAAFKVIDRYFSFPVNFNYGLDMYHLDGIFSNVFNRADIRGQAQSTLHNSNVSEWTAEDEADTVLGTESLTAPADFSQVQWALAGEFAVDGTFATYTFAATGLGTVTQTAAGNLAIDGIGNQRYRLDYTISAAPTVVGAVMTLTNAFGLPAVGVPMPIVAGANTVYFESAIAPANFVIDITGATAGVFTIEQASLTQVQSGGLVTRGPIRPVGVTFADLPAAVNGSIMYCVNCDPAVAGAGPTVCASAGAATGALAIRVAGAWTCLGI